MLTKTGEENAGVIDIGDGLGVAFKIESHNHPSAIEPYEGAATGVGGIVRDIFAMGARPVAILDSLRFGPLLPDAETSEDAAARNRHLMQGVVAGIAGYGNCIGIPTVGGEVGFSPSYSGNPLVNAMCVGVGHIDRLVKARADGPGNLLMLVGADTGRDGIHGATFASVELDETSEERRPAVQVGNPFLEKLLMEACLQLTEEHGDWIVGLQDLGAAGLTSASVECAAKAGTGIIIDVAKVPRRESGMTPYEVMLSESQERMLVIVKPEYEDDVRALFERWELHCATIGVVTDDGFVRVRDGEREVVRVAAKQLTDAPAYVREGTPPQWLRALQTFDFTTIPDVGHDAYNGSERKLIAGDVLLQLLTSPEIASKRTIWRQYDHQVGTNTVAGPGSDAAVIRIKGTRKAIAISTDGNAVYTYLDPYAGGAIAVTESARNVACTGARPIAMTDCLNFGNPEKPEVYWQLKEAIRGMADAALALGVPVISGNVSLYNETNGEAIWPTPVAGCVGLLEDAERAVPMGFAREGDQVAVVADGLCDSLEDALAGSQYLSLTRGITAGRPRANVDGEARMQRFLIEAAAQGLLASAHDVSAGGLAIAVAECCIAGDVGIAVALEDAARIDSALFGEASPKVVVSTRDLAALRELAASCGLEVRGSGIVEGARMRLGPIDVPLTALLDAY